MVMDTVLYGFFLFNVMRIVHWCEGKEIGQISKTDGLHVTLRYGLLYAMGDGGGTWMCGWMDGRMDGWRDWMRWYSLT